MGQDVVTAIKPPLQAGGHALAIVPQDFDSVWRLAGAIAKSGMAPKGIQTQEAISVAIMHGLEVGFTPMMALQSIAVINGRPAIWGDGLLALVRSSGLCLHIKEWIDKDTAYCETKRLGEERPVVRSFSIADAKAAGLYGKEGPWRTYPQRMLQMRARAWCLRDVYADVLRGLSVAEEVQDTPPETASAPLPEIPDPDAPSDPQTSEGTVEAAGDAPVPHAEATPAATTRTEREENVQDAEWADAIDIAKMIDDLEMNLPEAESYADLTALKEPFRVYWQTMSPEQRRKVDTMIRERREAIGHEQGSQDKPPPKPVDPDVVALARKRGKLAQMAGQDRDNVPQNFAFHPDVMAAYQEAWDAKEAADLHHQEG